MTSRAREKQTAPRLDEADSCRCLCTLPPGVLLFRSLPSTSLSSIGDHTYPVHHTTDVDAAPCIWTLGICRVYVAVLISCLTDALQHVSVLDDVFGGTWQRACMLAGTRTASNVDSQVMMEWQSFVSYLFIFPISRWVVMSNGGFQVLADMVPRSQGSASSRRRRERKVLVRSPLSTTSEADESFQIG